MPFRIPALTGVRGLAALWVLFAHVQNAGPNLGLPWLHDAPMLSAGWHGVDLFFILSGFVLMRTHAHDFMSLRSGPIIAFFKLRFSRVYPLNFVVLLLIACLVAVSPGLVAWVRAFAPHDYTLAAFIKTALLVTRWGLPGQGEWNEPVWSLSAEIVGYIGFPVLAWILMRRRAGWFAGCIGVGSLLCLNLLQIVTHTGANNHIGVPGAMSRMMFNFVAGAALARAFEACPGRWFRMLPVMGVISLALVVAICLLHKAEWALADCFALLVFCLATNKGLMGAVFSSPPFMFLGRVSFPLYLVHVTPLFWLQYALSGVRMAPGVPLLAICGYIAFCVGVSFLLHIWVERPSHAWGRRWAASSFTRPKAHPTLDIALT